MTTKKKAEKIVQQSPRTELQRLKHVEEHLYIPLKRRVKQQDAELAELREKLADQEERELARQAAAQDQAAELPRGGDLASVADMARDLAGIPQDVLEELDRLRHIQGLYENLLADLEKIDAVEGYTRGKLPDGRLIKIDVRTGAFAVISLEEWNRIPAG